TQDANHEVEHVEDESTAAVEANQLEGEPDADRDRRDDLPVFHEPARDGDQQLGDPRQLHLEIREDLLELRDDEDHDESQDADRDRDDDDGVNHRALDAAGQALGLFLELGKAAQNDFERAARLAGPDHVDVESVKTLGMLG